MAVLLDFGILMVFIWLFWWWKRSSIIINWPVVGMLPGLLSNFNRIHEFSTCLLLQSDGTFAFKGPWFTGFHYLITSDPMIVHYTLSKNFTNYQKGAEFKEIFEPLGDGIFNVDSDSWRFQRRTIHSLLKHQSFEMGLRRVMEEKILKGLFLVLDNAFNLGCEIDIQDVLQRFNFDSLCMLVLSHDPNCLSVELPQVDFEKAFDAMEEVIFCRHFVPMSVWKLQRWLQVGDEKKLRKAWETFDGFVGQIISKKREQLSRMKNKVETDNFDLLTYFLMEETCCEEGEDYDTRSDKFLRDMAFNLFLAGRDTVSAGLVWLFWLVTKHPDVETKILEEIKQQLGDGRWRLFSLEELRNLVYLHAVICETLRLYPPVPFEIKVAVESDTLPGYHQVAKDAKILYSLYTMGRMEAIWGEDCLDFKPERWISETGRIKHVPSYKFTAFNAGPRTCLGKELGFMEMKLVASAILWNYSIRAVENHPVSPSLSFMLYMKNGLKVRVSKRQAT